MHHRITRADRLSGAQLTALRGSRIVSGPFEYTVGGPYDEDSIGRGSWDPVGSASEFYGAPTCGPRMLGEPDLYSECELFAVLGRLQPRNTLVHSSSSMRPGFVLVDRAAHTTADVFSPNCLYMTWRIRIVYRTVRITGTDHTEFRCIE